MSGGLGRFAGKTAFGSSGPGARVFMTSWSVRASELEQRLSVTLPADRIRGQKIRLPAMQAKSVGQTERCILYAADDGIRIQMGDLSWIGLEGSLGWLILVDDPASAACFRLGGDPPGSRLKVVTLKGPETVVYTTGVSPILTLNAADNTYDSFTPDPITPSLDEIRRTKTLRDGDLADVQLAGADLTGLDLSGTCFNRADLAGAKLDGATLRGAHFQEAKLAGIGMSGAVLDSADFTRAHMEDIAWGRPKSAVMIVLEACHAQRAVLGSDDADLDCTGAVLSRGDFTGAVLSRLGLKKARLGGATLIGATLRRAVLDEADLSDVVAVGAKLPGASLQGVTAQGANLAGADLSGADLRRARLGSRDYLFAVPGALAGGLDANAYVQKDLIGAFSKKGLTLRTDDRIEVETKGLRWRVLDPQGPYLLDRKDSKSDIDVFRAVAGSPAILRRARCSRAKASGAAMAGVDLRQVRWDGQEATLDHADLEGASLAGGFFLGTNFTQCRLSGADLSGAVLIQATISRCLMGPGDSGRQISFGGAYLQGASFKDSTILGGLLLDAAVAAPRGVPLFDLPADAAGALDAGDLSKVADRFAAAGQPLGSDPEVSRNTSWLLDNHADPNTSSPRGYRVLKKGRQLAVFDAEDSSRELFELGGDSSALLSQSSASPALVAAFAEHDYTLAEDAPIHQESSWEVRPGGTPAPASETAPAVYLRMRVFREPDRATLPVFGSVLVRLRDRPDSPEAIAFGATVALQSALDPASVGPAGLPMRWVTEGKIAWLDWLRAPLSGPASK